MIRYHITDRKAVGGTDALLALLARNVAAGVDYFQIREKDLPDRELYALTAAACRLGARVLVNSRVDIAIAAGAAGVHLPADAIPPAEWRRITPPGFLIAISCHSAGELATPGADFAVYGPVFRPLSKQDSRTPAGIEGLAEACRVSPIPVLALGGITEENVASCIAAGAAGIAAITLFQR